MQRQIEVEYLSRVDLSVHHELDEIGQVAAHRSGSAKRVDFREKQLKAGNLNAVIYANEAHVAPRPCRMDGLHKGLLRADRLDYRVSPEPFGHVFNHCHTFGTALRHDVGSAELACKLLAMRVPAHRDDPFSAHLLGREHRAESNRAVSHYCDCLATVRCSSISAEPASAENVGNGQEAWDQIVGWKTRCRYQRAIGQRNSCQLSLGADCLGYELAVHALGW